MPQTFMNASGRAVQMLAGFFQIPPAEVLVVHAEVGIAPGTARLKQGGGIAGHNGLKDISQRLGTHDYWRLRIGVGRPTGDSGADYVLERPPAEEREAIEGAIGRALEHVPLMRAGDMQGAMQKLHSEDKPVVKKAEAPKPAAKPEPKRAEPKKAEATKAPPKDDKPGLLKGLRKGLTGSRK